MNEAEGTLRDGRVDPRTNLFVVGTIYTQNGSAPVKIRNLSASGALVEGGVIPGPATKMRLSRGSLTIVGKVVWRNDTRAGLKFDSRVSVADWLPSAQSVGSQQQIDSIVEQIRAAPKETVFLPDPEPGEVTQNELINVKRLIEALAEDLADDSDVIIRHASKLQALDRAAQLLEKLILAHGAGQ